jgi:dihydropteroate synthase type 2
VNITADSFSDGGKYLLPEAAVAQARRLLAEGADIVDLGAAASNPDAAAVEAEVEIQRLGPVIDALMEMKAAVSVDSFASETQQFALARGVGYLNDIRGFAEPAIYPQLAAARCKLIVMHSVQDGRASRVELAAGEVWDRIRAFFGERIGRLEKAGIGRERLILDPGMGFFLSSEAGPSIRVLADLGKLRDEFGLPVHVSVSRKSFLRKLTGRDAAQIGAATLAAELWAAMAGADYIRTHDVGALRDGLRVMGALRASK